MCTVHTLILLIIMASLEDTKINLTTCSICFETFKTPKHFPCLHSFCEGCIHTYIETTFGEGEGGVNCPVCRMFVAKPDDVSVQEWSVKLPTNHILVSLIDANESKSGQKICIGCSRENETESACSWCVNCNEYLCKTCDRCHRRGKTTSNHKIVELGDNSSIDEHLQHADVLCTEHVEEKVKAYCSDHNVFCCMACVMLQHRTCEHVLSIENVADQMKQSKEVIEFEKNLNNLKHSLEKLITRRDENLQRLDTDISKIKTGVDSLFTELTDHLSQLKSNMISQISKTERDVRAEIEGKRDELTCKVSALEIDIALFQTIMKSSPPSPFLQTVARLSEQKSILENYVKDQNQKLKEIQVLFQANEKLDKIRENIHEFGHVEVQRRVDMLIVEPTLTSDVITTGSGGELTIFRNDQIMLSNFDEKTVELRDSVCQNVLSSLSLQGRPYGIKVIRDTKGAVAVRGRGLVLFSIQSNHIEKIGEIKIDVYRDFLFFKGKYYIGCDKGITVFDCICREVHEILVNNSVNYMAIRDSTSLCYTVVGKHELYCITMDGTQVFTYSHDKLEFPRGVTVDHAGYIYVCGGNSRNVHQLNHDGKLQRIMFDNLPAGPYCISFNTQSDKAVIGCRQRILLYNI